MKWYRMLFAFALFLVCFSADAQQQSAADRAQIEYYRDYAIISTSCATWEDAKTVAESIVRKGGVVSVMLSPQRFLGWVPDSVNAAVAAISSVAGVQKTSAFLKVAQSGPDAEAVAAGVAHFQRAKSGTLRSSEHADSSERQLPVPDRFSSELSEESVGPFVGERNGANVSKGRSDSNSPSDAGKSMLSVLPLPPGDMNGLIRVNLFLVQYNDNPSRDWTDADIEKTQDEIYGAFDFWTRAAARYGRSVSFHPTWFSPKTTTVTTVPYYSNGGTHTSQDPPVDCIRTVMLNLGFDAPFGSSGSDTTGSGEPCLPCEFAKIFNEYPDPYGKEFVRLMKYNELSAAAISARQAFCIFIENLNNFEFDPLSDFPTWAQVLLSTDPGSGWPGLIESSALPANTCIGPYMTTSCRRQRMFIIGQIGRIFGAQTERRWYASCLPPFPFRGVDNFNCEATNPNSVSTVMRNWVSGYQTNELSSVTPIHVGWTQGPPRKIRFRTEPEGIPMYLTVGLINRPSIESATELYLGLGYNVSAGVPVPYTLNGTKYYFYQWADTGNPDYSRAGRTIVIDSITSEYVALFSPAAGGAELVPNSVWPLAGVSEPVAGTNYREWKPSVVLVWSSRLTDARAGYRIQVFENNAWSDLPGFYSGLNPSCLTANITHTPAGPIQAGTAYRFRVVAITAEGVPVATSQDIQVMTNPANQPSETYGYDGNESNDSPSTATPLTSSPSTGTQTIPAAITYFPRDPFGYSTEKDYYILTVTGSITTETHIVINRPRTRVLSDFFMPRVTLKLLPDGEEKIIGIDYLGDRIRSDGQYLIKVEGSQRGYPALVDSEFCYFGNWGEYSIIITCVQPRQPFREVVGCPECFTLTRIPGGGGDIWPISPKGPHQRIWTSVGYRPLVPHNARYEAVPQPGYEFGGWEGDATGNTNPDALTLDPQRDAPGIRNIMARYVPLPADIRELVVDIPQAWQSVLGSSRRYRGPVGSEIEVELPAAALSGFDFLGWQANAMDSQLLSWDEARKRVRVDMRQHLRLRPYIRPRPCASGGELPFSNRITIVNAVSQTATLQYGMQPGASDSLEAGQMELPPLPVSGVADCRFLNIAGAANGSVIDIRGMKPSFTFTGHVQPGDNGNPVSFSWDAISPTMPGTFILTVGNEAADMRLRDNLTVDVGTASSFRIEYIADTCRQLPTGELKVHISEFNASNFPYVSGRACVTDKEGNPVVTVRPEDVWLFQKHAGKLIPGVLRTFRPADDCYFFDGILNDTIPRNRANKDRGVSLVVDSPDPLGEAEDAVDFSIPIPDTGQDTTNGNGKSNIAYPVRHGAGWQLVSLPLQVTDPNVKAVYGDGTVRSPLYGFDPTSGYLVSNALEFSRGYWLKFSASGESKANGLEQTIFEIKNLPGVGQAAANGWNLIGGISYDVNRDAIAETPAGAILSLFEFANGYKPATVLKSGQGYWVKLKPNSTLRIVKSFTGSGGDLSKSATDHTPYERVIAGLPRVREWRIRDASGGEGAVFTTSTTALGRLDADDYEATELPPLPPSKVFDARVASSRIFAEDGEAIELFMQGTFPFTLSTAKKPGSVATRYTILTADGAELGRIEGAAGGSVTVPASAGGGTTARIVIRKEAESTTVPSAFSLAQAYPNPLRIGSPLSQPATIEYTVAEEGRISVTVYDVLGRAVKTLVHEAQAPGMYATSWDATDALGRNVPSGTYLYELRAGDVRLVRHLSVIR